MRAINQIKRNQANFGGNFVDNVKDAVSNTADTVQENPKVFGGIALAAIPLFGSLLANRGANRAFKNDEFAREQARLLQENKQRQQKQLVVIVAVVITVIAFVYFLKKK